MIRDIPSHPHGRLVSVVGGVAMLVLAVGFFLVAGLIYGCACAWSLVRRAVTMTPYRWVCLVAVIAGAMLALSLPGPDVRAKPSKPSLAFDAAADRVITASGENDGRLTFSYNWPPETEVCVQSGGCLTLAELLRRRHPK